MGTPLSATVPFRQLELSESVADLGGDLGVPRNPLSALH